ncbi:acyl-CoA thioesterase [Pengzhenrongella frigida]|uniref:Acyl-CoA thioesterase n=1 Tax=Pengzhenrongella frigida TaxID=1259133 RepID=A0A4Q5N1M9_9MICO|nr:thioesterase family protein [Cellulomonas sp. HLT2-17]RYV52082.1 acyl-CoA thioesterase [Cellulomonas sp. HLT2-17]
MSIPSANCRIERLVEWGDTDAAGIAHNSATMRWVEACEAQLMRDLDLPLYFPTAPRVQQTVNFTAVLSFGQRISVELTVQRVGTSSLTFAFTVVGAEFEGRPATQAAHGSVTTVHVPLGSMTSAPWPADVRARLVGSNWTGLTPAADVA